MAVSEQKAKLDVILGVVDEATIPLKMVQAQIAQLKIPAELRKAQKELKGLNSPFGRLKEKFAPALDKMGAIGSAAKNVGSEAGALIGKLALGFGAAGGAIVAFTHHFMEMGDQLGENAQRVGMTVDSYASLRFAAEQADVSQEDFATSMDKLNRNLGEMKAGGGSMLGFLEKVSPAFAKQVKGAKTTEEAMSLMTDAMAKIEDPAKRAAFAQNVFGKSGKQFSDFLAQGSGKIQAAQTEYMRLAGSQEAFAKAAGELDNALRPAQVALLSVGTTISQELFPAFSMIANEVKEFIVKNKDGIAKWAKETGEAIKKWVEGGGIQRLIKNIVEIKDKIVSFIGFIGGWKTVLVGLAAFMAGPLLVSLVTLGITIGPTALLIVAAVAGVVSIFKQLNSDVDWEYLKEQLGAVWTYIKDKAQAAWDFLAGIVGKIKKLIASVPLLSLINPALGAAVGGPTIGDAASAVGGALGIGGSKLPDPAAGISQSRTTSDSRVQVNFDNVPKNASISSKSNSPNFSSDVGYSMVGQS